MWMMTHRLRTFDLAGPSPGEAGMAFRVHWEVAMFLPSTEPQASVSLVAVPLLVLMGTVAGCIFTVCAVLFLLCWWRLKGPR